MLADTADNMDNDPNLPSYGKILDGDLLRQLNDAQSHLEYLGNKLLDEKLIGF